MNLDEDYTNVISIRKPSGDVLPLGFDKLLTMTYQSAVLDVTEFYKNPSKKYRSLSEFHDAIRNVVAFIADDLEEGDCLVYGKDKMKWAMVALQHVPVELKDFPRIEVPGTRLILSMIPTAKEKTEYLYLCLEKII